MPLAGQDILADDFAGPSSATGPTDETGFTNTTFSLGGTTVGVVFTAPTSGQVMVIWGGRLQSNTAAVRVFLSAEVRPGASIGTGTPVTSAATAASTLETSDQGRLQASRHRVVTGLTAGDTYNASLWHAVSAAGNGDIFDRDIAVFPLP